jgi:hypothetical protein
MPREPVRSRHGQLPGPEIREPGAGLPGTVPAGRDRGRGNGRGGGANQLYAPEEVAVHRAGNVSVADTHTCSVQKWARARRPGSRSPAAMAWDLGPASSTPHLMSQLTPRGNLYVSDSANCRVQLWVPGGRRRDDRWRQRARLGPWPAELSHRGSPCRNHRPPIRHRPRSSSTSPT